MKRSGLGRSGKPLERRTRLERRAHLQSAAVLVRTKRIAPVSPKKRAARRHEGLVREAVIARDGGCVLRFGQWQRFPRCVGALTFGHRVNASQGGAYVEENGACLCVLHNEMSEDYPYEAMALGIKIMAKQVPA